MLQIFSYLTSLVMPVGRMPKFIQSLNKYLLGVCWGKVSALGKSGEGRGLGPQLGEVGLR